MYRGLVIGCGNIGALYDFDNAQIITHAKAIHTDPRFSLSVFDINKELAKKISSKYNCEIIEEINEQTMQSFNCVSICTPTHTHYEFLEKGSSYNMLEMSIMVRDQLRSEGIRLCCTKFLLPFLKIAQGYVCNSVIFLIIFVEGQFIPNPQTIEYGNRHANGETSNVDDGITFIPKKISPSGFKIISEHATSINFARGSP